MSFKENNSEKEPLFDKYLIRVQHFFNKNYKKLMLIPILILLLSFGLLIYQYSSTGEIIPRGAGLKGGISITIRSSVELTPGELTSILKSDFSQRDILTKVITTSQGTKAYIIETDFDESELASLEAVVQKTFQGLKKEDYSIEIMSSALGESFFRQTIKVLFIAFLLMGAVIFFYFREKVPAIAIVFSTFSNMVIVISIMTLFGYRFSTSGIAALLMLIGYASDSNVLLSTKIFKEKEGTLDERVRSAFKTGLLMFLTTGGAVLAALLLSKSEVIDEIMLVIFIGLAIDFMNTWVLNHSFIKLYLDNKKKKSAELK
jgi:preprotein translocase subunit SecF